MDRRTDRQTDQPMDRAGCRVVCTRLKSCDGKLWCRASWQTDWKMDRKLKRSEEAIERQLILNYWHLSCACWIHKCWGEQFFMVPIMINTMFLWNQETDSWCIYDLKNVKGKKCDLWLERQNLPIFTLRFSYSFLVQREEGWCGPTRNKVQFIPTGLSWKTNLKKKNIILSTFSTV